MEALFQHNETITGLVGVVGDYSESPYDCFFFLLLLIPFDP